jgi:hypothetical protein
MKASILESPDNRPLSIDFDLYTDGDADFKKELITLMIENLRELQKIQQQNDPALFLRVCHKVKSTLDILNDNDLTNVINHLSDAARKNEPSELKHVAQLHTLCEGLVRSLQEERN